MTNENQQRICAVRLPGTSRARFADAGTLDVTLGDWVAIPSPAGEEPAQIVVAPDQWLTPIQMDDVSEIVRALSHDELDTVATHIERALGLIDQAASVFRDTASGTFLSGLRFNLRGDHLIALYIGPAPDNVAALAAALNDKLGIPATIEQERAGDPERGLHGGGTGKPATERPETFHELLRQRFDVLRDPEAFAPHGMPRLGSKVSTPDGSGRLIAVDIRHWKATVALDSDAEITVSVDDLEPPSDAE